MKMSWGVLVLTITTLPAINAPAQQRAKYTPQNEYSIAVFAGEFRYDTGIGAEIGFPAFFNNTLCVRIRGNMNWLEQYKAGYDQWVNYKSVGGSFVYNFLREERCRLFVEAGPSLILPDRRFSKKPFYQGFNASTGLEMFVLNTQALTMCYYFSVGIVYSRAKTDNLENQEMYGKGFAFTNGFRFYF